ncbi:MAG: lasso peptide biosynthesis B2 protein [Candidatus Electrothrix sp. MAN1_4]|nr:lasso peptide biosynthesis B2 protein [Candidatus Electrothrix sp. MAN1_4]
MSSTIIDLRTAVRKFHTIAGLDRYQQLWIIPLFFLSGLLRMAVLILPFRWISPLLGKQNKNISLTLLATQEQEIEALRTGRVVRAVSKYTPWESKCLIQALLAAIMLRLRSVPFVVFLGMARSKEEKSGYAAHAWLTIGRCAVTGGRGNLQYGVVAVYIFDPCCKSKPEGTL